MNSSILFFALAVFASFSSESLAARIQRTMYMVGHHHPYGNLPLGSSVSYAVAPYPHDARMIQASPYIQNVQPAPHVQNIQAPLLQQAASTTSYVAVPRYYSVPITHYIEPYPTVHGIAMARLYAAGFTV